MVPFSQLNRTLPSQDKPLPSARSSARVLSERSLEVSGVPSLQGLCLATLGAKPTEKASQSRSGTAGVIIGRDPVGEDDAWAKHALELIRLLEQAVARRIQLGSEVQWLHNCSRSSSASRDESGHDTFLPSSRTCTVQGLNNQPSRNEIVLTDECSAGNQLTREPLSLSSEGAVARLGTVTEGRASVGILFSGGVDSAVLAAITDRWVDNSSSANHEC